MLVLWQCNWMDHYEYCLFSNILLDIKNLGVLGPSLRSVALRLRTNLELTAQCCLEATNQYLFGGMGGGSNIMIYILLGTLKLPKNRVI